ncbi:FAD-dependent tricarballylate dehydrogenase TcuA [Solwaraspora sp. WMMD1047]|uniref:FAD-dependent tricarballylate dehydrogenase TcuA n=1 Tax=Solwaraspora sp. WMMD1047 TaxID=3016102 RepID=UPI0024174E43|nr:FAD-dependent tricarballylate dehydrogenase TcuA [Solwaraspora sp. WMMD1047]MDG4830383.1 FAD-dependent tricarballylate dehydrogenase TcuA [Solwaraspora sp. WMMD1047]
MTDVVIIGAGNAGLCAALAAVEAGARATVVEWAERDSYGSDSYFSGGLFRIAYDDLTDLERIVGPMELGDAAGLEDHRRYDESDFLADWGRVTGYRCDLELADQVVSRSFETLSWMSTFGVPFRSPIVVDETGRARHSRPGWHGGFVEVSGAGVGLTEALLKSAEKAGVAIVYGVEARDASQDPTSRRWTLTGRRSDGTAVSFEGDALIVASGGFQADTEWRTRALGPGWDLAKVRGSRFNTGRGLRIAMEHGGVPYGNWSGCHAVAWSTGSGEAGRADANHVFERESYPFGITVNRDGLRFIDEGSDFGAYTYARYGREILRQPGQTAWQLFDQQAVDLMTTEYHYKNPEAARLQLDSIEKIADRLATQGVDRDQLLRTVAEYNQAVDGATDFSPYVKDGKRTNGLAIDKTNWATPLTKGPFYAFEVTCGITFTFGGVRVNEDSAVLDRAGRPLPGLYACGEAVGGLYYFNYPSGTGLTAGAVLGRAAGTKAAATTAAGGRA